MPDHLHALLSFPVNASMAKTISQFKAYQNRHCNIKWQNNFFDHRIRTGENLDEKALYIRANPVRAGLCSLPEKWPYIWAPTNENES